MDAWDDLQRQHDARLRDIDARYRAALRRAERIGFGLKALAACWVWLVWAAWYAYRGAF